MIPKIVDAHNDFSAGELDPDVKRSGSPLIKMGGRQMSNWRVLNSHKKANRPGRFALFIENGRVEEIGMPNGNTFYLLFDGAVVKVYNAAGTNVFVSGAMPWTGIGATVTYAIIGFSIYLAFPDGAPNNVPQILTWDGVSQTSTWTQAAYAETVTAGGQKRTAFYRISPPNITMQPGAANGSVSLTFSGNVLVSGMIGTRFRFCGRQLVLTAVTSALLGTATVIEPLPPGQTLTLSSPVGTFNIGDVVQGSISAAQGIVTSGPATQQIYTSLARPNVNIGDAVSGGTSGATGIVTGKDFSGDQNPNITVHLNTGTLFQTGELVTDTTTSATFTSGQVSGSGLTVQILANDAGTIPTFSTSDLVVGPSGSSAISAVSTVAPQAVSVWDDEVMNTFRGFPSFVFSDQGRLGFCNVPSVKGAVIWSAIGLYTDLYTGAQPDNSIFEIAPDQSQVLYTIPGMESSEFVFTDRAIYYIPISTASPLLPGGVDFRKLSDYGCFAGVQPRRAEQSIVFVKAGGAQIGAVQAPGAYYRPYVVDNLSEMHSHLFTASTPIAIAIPSASTEFEELYIYIALANGTAVVGRYMMRNGLIEPGPEGKPSVGWLPWNGAGTIQWVAARQGDVIFLTVYPGLAGQGVVERQTITQFLDGAIGVNNLQPPFVPPGGKGPLFKFPGPNTTVFLIDGGRFMGTYNVDANGFIIPQNIDGENLSSVNLLAGFTWTAVFEPFIAQAPAGGNQKQGMRKRRIAKGLVAVQNSTGFVFGTRRIPYYFVGEDPTQSTPLREDAYKNRPRGRSYDPRITLTKDLPGPLTVNEYEFEVTV